MRKFWVLMAALAGVATLASAQFPGGMQTIPAPDEPRAVALYAGAAPGSEHDTQKLVWTQMGPQRWERNVTHPSIIPIAPPADKANGAAVLVVPGGGFQFLSMDNEGYNVAKRLNAQGVTAFILQYRTMVTPEGNDAFKAAMAKVFDPRTPKSERTDVNKGLPFAVADAQMALKYIRAHAADYQIDPKRIGMIGFSAGAMTTFGTVMADAAGEIPDYAGVIYGPTSMEVAGPGAKVPADAPPMFSALARDDQFFSGQNLSAIEAWRSAGKQVEFHLYEGGGHGFASFPNGHTSDLWFDEFTAWMKTNKWLDRQN